MTKEEFRNSFDRQIVEFKEKLGHLFEPNTDVPFDKLLAYLMIHEMNVENVTLEMKDVRLSKIDEYDCSNLEFAENWNKYAIPQFRLKNK